MIGDNYIPWANWQRAGLNGHGCPYCRGHRTLKLRRLANYPIDGRTADVAFINVCEACGGHVVTETEWRVLTQG